MTSEKTQNPNLAALSEAGVSVWLDDLSRDRLRSGNLQELIDTRTLCRDVSNLFLDHRVRANLPRKFNIAVCGRSNPGIHYWTQDIALLAVEHGGRIGFRVLVGGKQGQTPQLGRPLPMFLPPGSATDLVATILDFFQAEGPREKRAPIWCTGM